MCHFRNNAPLLGAWAEYARSLILWDFPSFLSYCLCSVGSSVGRFSTRFELADCALGERRIAMQIMRIQDCIHVVQAVAGQGGDLRCGAPRGRKPCDGRTAKIVKCQ